MLKELLYCFIYFQFICRFIGMLEKDLVKAFLKKVNGEFNHYRKNMKNRINSFEKNLV